MLFFLCFITNYSFAKPFRFFISTILSKNLSLYIEIMNMRLFKVGLIVILISSCSNKTVQESLLTIDTLLQNKADTLLTTSMIEHQATSGKAIIMETILFQNQYPSWLYEIEHNATTIWERWNAVLEDGTRTITSYNHYAFGCIGDW